jgi:hypothetical protein
VTRERADPTADDDSLNQLIGATRDAVDDPLQNAVENTSDAVEEVFERDFAQAADDAAGSADERIQDADFSAGAADALTGSGGLLSETGDDTGGVIPGETTATIRTPDGQGGVDTQIRRIETSEQRLTDTTQTAQQAVEGIDLGATVASPADPLTGTETAAADDSQDPVESAVEGAVTGVSGAILGAPTAAETAIETAQNVDETTDEFGAATVAETGVALTRETSRRQAEVAQEDPARFTGSVIGDVLLGAGAGRLAGTAGRAAIDRSRTVGAREIDPTEITTEDVIEGDERFPGFDDEALAQQDPAEAVRQQAPENTPDEIERGLDRDAGVLASDEADVVKAMDQPVDGRGPDFESPEGDFESPGAFVGPELSPNFLRIESPEDRQLSVVPGLPDISGRPTGAVIRTPVENPDASNLREFNQELRDRAGEQTALTKPPSEVNPGEAEAVLPPRTQFRATDAGRADFFTEIDGRRVPVRTFARDRDGAGQTRAGTGADGIDGELDGAGQTRAGTGADGIDGERLTAGQIDELTERVDPSRRDGNLSPATAPVGELSDSRQRDVDDSASRSVFADRGSSSAPSPSPSPSQSPSPSPPPSSSPSPPGESSGGFVSSQDGQLFGSEPSTPRGSSPSSPAGGTTSATPPRQSTRTPGAADPDDDDEEPLFDPDDGGLFGERDIEATFDFGNEVLR